MTENILIPVCLFSSTITMSLLIGYIKKLKRNLFESQEEIKKEKELRKIERKGRITIQQKKREDIQKEQYFNGYHFNPIGYIESPFPDRRGTPRQPNLVRAATGRIKFDKKRIQHEHFKELKEFSHIWIIWVFHENTNLDSNNLPAKIKPPRLHGSRVGCLSTRSPHRPNPIGLSVSEIITVGIDYIDIVSIDMIDGTPILDSMLLLFFSSSFITPPLPYLFLSLSFLSLFIVKPYIPYDIIPSSYNISMAPVDDNNQPIPLTSLLVPSWIYESDIPLRQVNFTENSLHILSQFEELNQFKYCQNKQHAMQLIKQVLRQDIRSGHQGRSTTLTSLSPENSETLLYECHLDSFTIQFCTFQDYILVENIFISENHHNKK